MKTPKRSLKTLKAPLKHLPIRPARTYESRLNREQSTTRVRLVPILTVMLGSMLTTIPLITQEPILPPFGLLMFLAWRLMRPGIWPAWIGLPLGLFDDLFSGQPFGSSGLIWSVLMITAEIIDSYARWRDHWQDWLIATAMIISALFAGLVFAGWAYKPTGVSVLLPQILLSIMCYPLVVRLCSLLDGWRLAK